MQKEYSDDGLRGYTVSSLRAVRHCYIRIFLLYGMLCFLPPAVRAWYILGLRIKLVQDFSAEKIFPKLLITMASVLKAKEWLKINLFIFI